MRGRIHRLTNTLLLAVLCCALVTGCAARQSQDQYEEGLRDAMGMRAQVLGKLAGGGFEDRAEYDAAARQILESMEALNSDAPPRELQVAHDRMNEAMRGLATLLGRLGRCIALESAAPADAQTCRQSIDQTFYDEIRNDFGEADTIYREKGFSLRGMGSGDGETGAALGSDGLDGEVSSGGDEL